MAGTVTAICCVWKG